MGMIFIPPTRRPRQPGGAPPLPVAVLAMAAMTVVIEIGRAHV